MFKRCLSKKGFITLMMATSCLGATAFGETTVTTTQNVRPSLTDKLALSYFGIFNGPSLTSIDEHKVGSDGKPDGFQNFDSQITLGYRPSKNIVTGAAINFLAFPVHGEGFTLKDPFLKVSNSKFVDLGAFNVVVDLRAYLPVSTSSQKKNMLTGLRSTQITTYDVPGTRLTVAAYTFARYNFYSGTSAGDATDFSFDISPFFNYKLSQKVSATLWTDIVQLNHARGASWGSMQNDPMDVQPGVNFDITEKISLNPFINFLPQNLSLDSSSIGLVINAKAM